MELNNIARNYLNAKILFDNSLTWLTDGFLKKCGFGLRHKHFLKTKKPYKPLAYVIMR